MLSYNAVAVKTYSSSHNMLKKILLWLEHYVAYCNTHVAAAKNMVELTPEAVSVKNTYVEWLRKVTLLQSGLACSGTD
jgi:hypothetical protein